jgi:hypothetical protein
MDIAGWTLPHHAARIPLHNVRIATLRYARVATTGRELGDSACARPEIGTRKDRSRFCRSVNDIAIKKRVQATESAIRNVRRQSTAPEP